MKTRDLSEGMTVRSADGEKLGKIVARRADGFVIEKGFFFPKDYFATYENVVDVRGDEIYLDMNRDSLVELGKQQGETWGARSDIERKEEVRIPLAEEELVAEKRARQTGEVRVEKEVVTEEKEITVPVRREEVRVERGPATGTAPVGAGAFEKETVRVPVTEEEVEIRKRPVVREEVRVEKDIREEQRTASAPVRRETVDVEEEGSARRSPVDEEDLKKT